MGGINVAAANLINILTYVALGVSDLPSGTAIGSGAILDTSRFRFFCLAETFKLIQDFSIRTFGEHDDTNLPVWSLANIAGLN